MKHHFFSNLIYNLFCGIYLCLLLNIGIYTSLNCFFHFQTWSEIAKEFNESDVGPQRTAANLKKAYENMKAQ